MAHDSDGMDEAFDAQMRVALLVATQMGERIARARQDIVRELQARSEHNTKRLQSRLSAERSAARAAVFPVSKPSWWAAADARTVGEVWQIASSWRGVDPVIDDYARRMTVEIKDRYGIDTDAPNADPAATAAYLRGLSENRDYPAPVPPQLLMQDVVDATSWAKQNAPEYYHRHDPERLQPVGSDQARTAAAELVADYKHALAEGGTIPEMSLVTEWARAHNQAGWNALQHAHATAIPGLGEEPTVFLDPLEVEAAVLQAELALRQDWKRNAPDATKDSVTPAEAVDVAALLALADRADRDAAGHHTVADVLTGRAEEALDPKHQAELESAAVTERLDAHQATQDADGLRSDAAEVDYDSPVRRVKFREELTRADVPDTAVTARLIADTGQGTHPSTSVTAGKKKAPVKASKGVRTSPHISKGTSRSR